jgi:two-component system chemotaxis response regulator CheB
LYRCRKGSNSGEILRVLIAEDDRTSALLLEHAVTRAGHEALVVQDGQEALSRLGDGGYDAVLTDWMMPRMDGIELIRRAREDVSTPPIFLVVTALASAEARQHALRAGADDYIAKPFSARDVLERLENCFARHRQPEPARPQFEPAVDLAVLPPRVGVCIAASTGGPEALKEVIGSLGNMPEASLYVVQHGPTWMLETFAARLQEDAAMPVRLAKDGMQSQAGVIYIAPGDRHMTVDPETFAMRLNDEPPENYMRPAADPLFRSVATAFGPYGIAVVLTGMGRDGTLGAATIAAAGGVVLAQDPRTAVASSMPQTAVNIGAVREVVALKLLGTSLRTHIHALAQKLAH